MIHLLIIAVMAMASLGVWTAMGEGMILEPLKKRYDNLPNWARKPLSTCPRCMVSTWGTTAVVCLGLPFDLYAWPAYALCAVGLQEMLHR